MSRPVIIKLTVEFAGRASRELIEFVVGEIGRTREQRRNLRSEFRTMFWEDLERERETRKPLCGARTRSGGSCARKAIDGRLRCRNHGGASTGPRSAEGKARIAQAQRARWKRARSNV
jgi:hypothetical protein